MKLKAYLLGVSSLLVAIGLSGCFFSPVEDGIAEVISTLESRDYSKIYHLSSPSSQKMYGTEGIIDAVRKLDNQLQTKGILIDTIDFDEEKSDKTKRIYRANMTIETELGDYTKQVTLPLVKIETKDKTLWRLDWYKGLSFPGLEEDDEVGVINVPAVRGMILDRDGSVLAKDVSPGKRVYPKGILTSDVVGFVRKATENDVKKALNGELKGVGHLTVGENLGRVGLELAYQDELSGTDGTKIYLKSAPNEILFRKAPINGKDIQTTLDLKVQRAAYNQLVGEYGAASAINPQNGEVLALVSTPSLNVDAWTDEVLSATEWERLESSGNAPTYEGNFSQTFLPGSTQKLLTTIIGLNNNVIKLDSSSGYQIVGERWQPDTSWGGYKVHRVTPIDGFMTLKKALIYSDNIYFSRVALDLGIETYTKGLKNLGIAEEVPSDLPIYKSRISNSGVIKGPIALADTSYGQAQNLISPIQMNLYYASLLNNGKVYAPKLRVDKEAKVWKGPLTSKENINFINLALEQAVNIVHPNAKRNYARISGKTGTAEVGRNGETNLGWFCGYDLNNPEFSMCLMVNYVENRGGSDVNTGKFGRVMDELYRNGIKYRPSGLSANSTAENTQTNDTSQIK